MDDQFDPYAHYQPYVVEQILSVVDDPQHELHEYFNFDDEIPADLFKCPEPTDMPGEDEYEEARGWATATTMRKFLEEECPTLREEFVIYGTIGRGTFGIIFAARSRKQIEGKYQHYAIKVQPYLTTHDFDTNIGYVEEQNRPKLYVHKEAFILHFLRGSDRVTQLHSAYLHAPFACIVMNQFSVDFKPEMNQLGDFTEDDNPPKFPGYNGVPLINKKAPRLTEQQVCKVVSHLLEALMFLDDRNFTHQDLSHRNYLVDENLNTQLIDHDADRLALTPEEYRLDSMNHIYALEHMISPELALPLLIGGSGVTKHNDNQKGVDCDADIRDEPLWKLGVIMFELLHGYPPWDSPDPRYPDINFQPHGLDLPKLIKLKAFRDWRRLQVVNAPLPISDQLGLTQDCVDVLNAMFQKDPADRPTIQELIAFPWFQGSYVDSGADFTRPARVPNADGFS